MRSKYAYNGNKIKMVLTTIKQTKPFIAVEEKKIQPSTQVLFISQTCCQEKSVSLLDTRHINLLQLLALFFTETTTTRDKNLFLFFSSRVSSHFTSRKRVTKIYLYLQRGQRSLKKASKNNRSLPLPARLDKELTSCNQIS